MKKHIVELETSLDISREWLKKYGKHPHDDLYCDILEYYIEMLGVVPKKAREILQKDAILIPSLAEKHVSSWPQINKVLHPGYAVKEKFSLN